MSGAGIGVHGKHADESEVEGKEILNGLKGVEGEAPGEIERDGPQGFTCEICGKGLVCELEDIDLEEKG